MPSAGRESRKINQGKISPSSEVHITCNIPVDHTLPCYNQPSNYKYPSKLQTQYPGLYALDSISYFSLSCTTINQQQEPKAIYAYSLWNGQLGKSVVELILGHGQELYKIVRMT